MCADGTDGRGPGSGGITQGKDTMTHIDATWQRIETWLVQNAPQIMQGLAPGATEEEIAAAEKIPGVALPEEVRDSYRIHDGQQTDRSIGGVIGGVCSCQVATSCLWGGSWTNGQSGRTCRSDSFDRHPERPSARNKARLVEPEVDFDHLRRERQPLLPRSGPRTGRGRRPDHHLWHDRASGR